MAIPDFQSTMLPLLRFLDDGRDHLIDSDHVELLARQFGLTNEEQEALLPSGKQAVFANRIAWATSYLTKAGLVERTGRKRIRITERGEQTLASGVPRIDIRYLARFPEFEEFRKRPESPTDMAKPIAETSTKTPDELLEESYQALRRSLAQDLLDRLKQSAHRFFETVVVDLLVAMGYGGSRKDAGQAVGGSGDDGIDGIIKEDKLGLDFVYIQAKRWDHPVSRPTVQAFAGSLEGHRARKGVFITTSQFTKDAAEYVTRIEKRIVLIDGKQLAELMIDHGIGVAEVATYHVKRVDLDYFGAE